MGPQVTLELPIFNQNQGNIAIETATRQQLHDEYAARLTAARTGPRHGGGDRPAVPSAHDRAPRTRRHTRIAATQAEAAFKAGNLDERSYVDLVRPA